MWCVQKIGNCDKDKIRTGRGSLLERDPCRHCRFVEFASATKTILQYIKIQVFDVSKATDLLFIPIDPFGRATKGTPIATVVQRLGISFLGAEPY